MATKKTEGHFLNVQQRPCKSCIYRKDSGLDLTRLEAQIADEHMPGFFKGHRVCHHSRNAVCAGFWRRHRDKFTLGQLAQRLGWVRLVHDDTLSQRLRDSLAPARNNAVSHKETP
jgi:hypothetical protein